MDDDVDQRQHEDGEADDVDPDLRALREAARDHVDLDVPLAQHRVAGGEQEHRGEQVPLDLEVGVRAGVERLADDRVERR